MMADAAPIKKTCKDCGEGFEISEGEKAWYEEKCMEPPKRCSSCRQKRREERQAERNQGA